MKDADDQIRALFAERREDATGTPSLDETLNHRRRESTSAFLPGVGAALALFAGGLLAAILIGRLGGPRDPESPADLAVSDVPHEPPLYLRTWSLLVSSAIEPAWRAGLTGPLPSAEPLGRPVLPLWSVDASGFHQGDDHD